MVRGVYQRIEEIWKKPKERLGSIFKERIIKWRKEHTVERVEKPTRLDKARKLGYRAKKGFVIARVRIRKGGRRRRLYGRRGRKPSKAGLVHFTYKQPHQAIAEQKAQRKFPNLNVLNSYWVGEDGQYKWFEIILVDPKRPEIQADPKISWIASQKHRKRALRGLTSVARKSR